MTAYGERIFSRPYRLDHFGVVINRNELGAFRPWQVVQLRSHTQNCRARGFEQRNAKVIARQVRLRRSERRPEQVPLPSDLVAFGEVGLGGEVRQVAHAPRRLSETARLGFRRVIAPRSAPDPETKDLRLVRVATLPEALAACGLIP